MRNERNCAHCGSTKYDECYSVPARPGTFRIVRCQDCDLVRLGDDISEEEYIAFYQNGTTTIHVGDELTNQSYDRYLAELAPFRQTGKLLEVGVGAGSFLRRAAGHGWACFGNDVSSVNVDHLHDVIPPSHLFQGYLEQAPFFGSLAPIDVCAMLGVLEHVPNFPDLLATIHRILRPGGAFFIDVPNYAAISRRILGAKWGAWDVPYHVSFFEPHTLQAALEKAGFRVQRIWTTGFNPVDLVTLFKKSRPTTTAASEEPASKADQAAYEASRVARRQRVDAIRRVFSKLGPTKAIINAGLNAAKAGDSLYCLAVNA